MKLSRKGGVPVSGSTHQASSAKATQSDELLLPKLMAERRRAAEASEPAEEKARRRETVANLLVSSLNEPIEALVAALPDHMLPEGVKKEVPRPSKKKLPSESKPSAVVAPTPATPNGRPTAMVAPNPNPRSSSTASIVTPPVMVNVTPNPTAAEQAPATGVVVGLPAGASSSGENYAVVSTTAGGARISRGSGATSGGGNASSGGTQTEASLIRASSSSTSSNSGPTPV